MLNILNCINKVQFGTKTQLSYKNSNLPYGSKWGSFVYSSF